MSSKKKGSKKKGGIKRTNAAHQTSSGKDQPKKAGIKRVDRNATVAVEVVKKGVSRTDKNKTSIEPTKSKGLARADKGARSVEPVKVKSVQRRDKNAQVKEPEKQKSRKIHATATKQSKGETKQFSGAKSGKMNQTSSSLGLEKVKISSKKGTRDANATHKDNLVTKKTGIVRRDANVQKSTEVKAKKKGGAKGGAFGQSTQEAKPKTVRAAKAGGGAFSQSSGSKPAAKSGLKTSKTTSNCQQKSNNIFGSKASTASAPSKNTSHMQSSFQFG